MLLLETKYFSVYGDRPFDTASFISKIRFNYTLPPESFTEEKKDSPKNVPAETVDALFSEVCDILDIHIYSYHGTIRIVPDQKSLKALIRQLYNVDFPERSIYIHDKNTIYISFEDLTVGMLGHEMAHAVMSHYFVVAPPAKVQEILAGYVEYNIRKSSGDLP